MQPRTAFKRSTIDAPASEVFGWHERAGAFERLMPPWEEAQVVERSGGLHAGARTVLRLRVGPVWVTWVAEHTAYEPGRWFRDEQREGPFRSWMHTHRTIEVSDAQSTLEDEITYELPFGGVGERLQGSRVAQRIARLLEYRHALVGADLRRHREFSQQPRQCVAVTGASGFVGTALVHFLRAGGHTVHPVARVDGGFDQASLQDADVVVHLAGAGVADATWTDARKRELERSRIETTRALVSALSTLTHKPKVLLSASGVGVYGDTGDDVVDESSPTRRPANPGVDFLSQLAESWESEAMRAADLGIRVACLRFGMIVGAQGGALHKMLLPFRSGAGGPIGSGDQWVSWIALDDALGAILGAMYQPQLRGPVNCVSPNPVSNRELVKTLGRVLRRPTVVPLPEMAVKTLFGEMGQATLLASQRVSPRTLTTAGFRFEFPDLEAAVRFTLGRMRTP